MDWQYVALTTIYAIAMILVVMTFAGYSVLVERKVAAWIQGRPGPNRTTIPLVAAIPVLGRIIQRLGIIQLPADGAKFLFKEDPTPAHTHQFYFRLAPCLALAPALITMVMLPFGQYTDGDGVTHPLMLCNVDTGFLFMFAISSLCVYGIILAGWSSNSKYPFLGAIRGSAQLISYELTMSLSVVPVVLATAAPGVDNPLNLFAIVQNQGGVWNLFVQPLGAFLFLIAVFAESNRQPFDMPESETDIVSGVNTEYGSFKFGLFYVGEYAHMVIGSGLFIVFFLGGWNLPFIATDALVTGIAGTALGVALFLAKLFFMVFFFVWVRWTVPRFRYDQVMSLGWNRLLPLAIVNLFAYFIIYTLLP